MIQTTFIDYKLKVGLKPSDLIHTEFNKPSSAIVPTRFTTHGRLDDVKMTFSEGRELST